MTIFFTSSIMSSVQDDNHERGVHEKGEKRRVFTSEEVKENLSQPDAIQWVAFKNLLTETPESCVDGRGEKGVVGVPGGNAGEFLLAVAAAESASGDKFSASRMGMALRRYVRRIGKIYMHTDEHAVGRMRVRNEPIDERILRNPPAKLREATLSEVVKPENIGCGHLKLMLAEPDIYGARAVVTEAFIREFYRELWRGNRDLELAVLRGEHSEGAVLVVEVKGEIGPDTPIPTIKPNIRGKEAFVYHPQMADHLREESTEWIGEVAGLAVDRENYRRDIYALAAAQLAATLERLARPGGVPLPLIRVLFHPDKTFTVSVVGNA